MPRTNELVDLSLYMHFQTERAILVSDDGDKKNAVWIAKSHCEWGDIKNNIMQVTMPVWLAKEKGFV